jgi:hypothetical protein
MSKQQRIGRFRDHPGRRLLASSSAFSGSLREKRFELWHYFVALAVGASNLFLVVLANCHRNGESLATLLAKIFVERHKNYPLFGLSNKDYSASIAVFHPAHTDFILPKKLLQ